MREGWVGEEYLILFEADELQNAPARYSFPELLPGYTLLGLRSWDEFSVHDNTGHLFTVPTVPVSAIHLVPFQAPGVDQVWTADERFSGKIKWYLKPLVFGGDPLSQQNQTWISHDQHAQLVRYWNNMYRSMNAHDP
ncbi:MAG TPA: hypothetical protein VF730_17145 [Terracidiphilus sp.]